MASRGQPQPTHEWDGIFRSSLLRSGHVVAGIALALFSLILLISLLTFSASDPSFTTAAGADVGNWMGRPGAYLASLALLLVGWPALMLVPMAARLAWRWIVGRDRAGPQRRLSIGLIGVLLTAIGVATWENFPTRELTAGWGGMIGMVAENPVDWLAGVAGGGFGNAIRILLAIILCCIGIVLWWRSLGLKSIRVALPGRTASDDDADYDDQDVVSPGAKARPTRITGGDDSDDDDAQRVEPRRPVVPVTRTTPETTPSAMASRIRRFSNIRPRNPSSAGGAKSSSPGFRPSETHIRSIGQPWPSR